MTKVSAIRAKQSYRQISRGGVAEQIAGDLREKILDGTLQRGRKLQTERELALGYGVSGPTIREALRVLSAGRLVVVRHGSGAYVTADADEIIATSLQSMIQIERIGLSEVLGVLAVLNMAAAELAAIRGTDKEILALREANARVARGKDIEGIVVALKDFLSALASASHNPFLAILCRFLAGLQIGTAQALVRDFRSWRETAGSLADERGRLVDAIASRDADAARDCARAYHQRALEVIMQLPNAEVARASDPKLVNFLTMLLRRPA